MTRISSKVSKWSFIKSQFSESWLKLLWTAKNGLATTKLRHKFFPCKFLKFSYVFLVGGFQSFLDKQNHFQSKYKVTNITSIDIILMSLLQYIEMFLSTLCTWRVRSSRPEKFYKKGIFKNSTKFTEKHLRQCLFYNKTAGWRFATSLNTESGTIASPWILRNV